MKITRISRWMALALCGMVACSVTAFAQDAKKEGQPKGAGRGANAQQRVDYLAKELSLTDAQKTKLTAVFEEQGKKMQELRDLTPEERRPKMQAIREEQDKKMKEILTPEQLKKWEEIRAQMPRRGEGKGKDAPKTDEKK